MVFDTAVNNFNSMVIQVGFFAHILEYTLLNRPIHLISPSLEKRCDEIPLSFAVNLIKRLLAVGAWRNPN